jgi:hypothetical protein
VSDAPKTIGYGAAQRSLAKPWRLNADGRRTIDEAVALARKWGVVIADDVQFVVRDDMLLEDQDARYAAFSGARDKKYVWEDLFTRSGKIVVKLRSTVLDSDEGILDVLTHEMHEINALRTMFEERGAISLGELIALTEPGRPKNLHDEAWDEGAKCVARFRAERAR